MPDNKSTALLIRSLLRELRLSDHVVYPQATPSNPKPKAIVASVVLRELDSDS